MLQGNMTVKTSHRPEPPGVFFFFFGTWVAREDLWKGDQMTTTQMVPYFMREAHMRVVKRQDPFFMRSVSVWVPVLPLVFGQVEAVRAALGALMCYEQAWVGVRVGVGGGGGLGVGGAEIVGGKTCGLGDGHGRIRDGAQEFDPRKYLSKARDSFGFFSHEGPSGIGPLMNSLVSVWPSLESERGVSLTPD